MIRICETADFDEIFEIINDAAEAYRGIIPADRWHDPYMPKEDLRHEMDGGVVFWGLEADGRLLGVMGLQDMGDVYLVRHAYVRTAERRGGIGGALVKALYEKTTKPTLIGTWAAADWAVRFYEKYGFRMVDTQTKNRLLKTYWTIPERQVETSVVLADERWWAANA
ncbi:MAG: GNAT family N-acetyltransferase [Rhodospirillales bacterium]|nr:GNAT family N-acetyltransferase [Rhodospirillales bacterium]